MKRYKIILIISIFALSILLTSALGILAEHERESDRTIVAKPWISILNVQGGLGVTVTVKNIGKIKGEDIPWTISFNEKPDKLIIIGNEKVGTIDIAPDETQTIKTGFVFGIGQAALTVEVGNKDYGPEKVLMVGPVVIKI